MSGSRASYLKTDRNCLVLTDDQGRTQEGGLPVRDGIQWKYGAKLTSPYVDHLIEEKNF